MGLSHRIYELNEENVSSIEAVKDLLKIYNSLCIGDDRSFFHQFKSDNLVDIEKVQSKFTANTQNMYSSFELYQTDKLIDLFKSIHLLDKISIVNSIDNTKKIDYLHYRMHINPRGFKVFICLPITEDFTFIKNELKDIFLFLAEREILEMSQNELIDLSTALFDSNLTYNDGYNYKKNGVEFFSVGNLITNESNQIRPTSVRMSFDENYMSKNGGQLNSLLKIYAAINEYFEQGKFKVKGSLVSKFDSDVFRKLNKFDFLNMKVNIALDLNKNTNFVFENLDLSSKYDSTFSIRNFVWKHCNSSSPDNYIDLYIRGQNKWSMQIRTCKKIDEEYYFNIELLINKELEYIGME